MWDLGPKYETFQIEFKVIRFGVRTISNISDLYLSVTWTIFEGEVPLSVC